MKKSYMIANAFYRVCRLRLMNPKISRCMLVSLMVVIAATAPLAHMNHTSDVTKNFPRFISFSTAAHQLFGARR